MSSTVQFISGSVVEGFVQTLTGNTGGAITAAGGNINVVGDGAILTATGDLSTHTITFSLLPASDGQVIIGSSSGNPEWATITPGAGITITNGANSIEIAATGEEQHSTFTSDATPTPIITIPSSVVGPGTAAVVTAQVTGAMTGAANALAATLSFGVYYPSVGNVTIIGSPTINVYSTNAATVSVTVDDIGENTFINVIGVAAENWNWVATYQIVTV